MNFAYSRGALAGRERRLARLFEVIPGLMSWSILLGMVALAIWKPLLAAAGIIAFDLYWLLRLLYGIIFLVLSYSLLRIEGETDWMQRIAEIDRLGVAGSAEERRPRASGFTRRLSERSHRKALRLLMESGVPPPASNGIRHVVIVPVMNESVDVVEPGIARLASQPFPPKQMLIVIALEARAPDRVKVGMRDICARFRNSFLEFVVVEHPDGLPGEARVKGSNVTYAARQAREWLAAHDTPLDRVVVSCFDADTIVAPGYFSCLTYHFMVCAHRTRASFQPIPVYHNNIWDAPGMARVLDIGSSFFQLIEVTNSHKLVTFSSHSMSFEALAEIDYWPVDIVSDDSAIFWKAFLVFEGNYRVVPMYVTVSMDVAASTSWWKTMLNVYRQKRRWAWGVENFPFVMLGFLRKSRIRIYDRITLGIKLLEGHVAWATWAFLLTIIGWLPLLFAGREFSRTVMYYSVPRVTGMIFRLSSLGLITTILISMFLLPPPPRKHALLKRLGLGLEWLMVPVIAMFLTAVPALDAQTRLLLGRRMEFWVTDKRKKGGA